MNPELSIKRAKDKKPQPNKWLTGKEAPAPRNGRVGDFYVNQNSLDYFLKTKKGWEVQGNLRGAPGKDGADGKNGWSAYKIWIAQGHEGSIKDFLNSLVGAPGKQGMTGPPGPKGEKGDKGERGPKGEPGEDGEDGREIELRKSDKFIQWKYVDEDDDEWRDLVALEELKGKDGGGVQIFGGGGGGEVIDIIAGTNITVDKTNPLAPVISAPDTGGDKNYHQAFTNESTIVAEHNLNKYPSVTVIDSAGSEVVGAIEYNDLNTVTVSFIGSFTGELTLN